MVIPISEFQRRSLTGPPIMKRQQFTLSFVHKVRELAAKYQIKFDPYRIIANDATADAVFEAGVELLADVGLYHLQTRRVVQLSREEIRGVAQEAWQGPRQETFGRGKDQVIIKAREPGEPRPPIIFVTSGTPVSREDLYIPTMLSFAQEEVCQGIVGMPLFVADGMENKAGTAGEIAAALTEIKYNKQIAQMVGRPDMFLGLPGTGTISPASLIACCAIMNLQRHQTQIPVHIHPDQMIDWTRLQNAYFAEQKGYVPFTNAVGITGALCRGPEESAIVLIANLLGQLAYGHGTIAGLLSIDAEGTRSGRAALWAASASHRAAGRHVGIPMGTACIGSKAGAGTEMAFYEKAAQVLNRVASGAAWFYAAGCRNSRGADTSTGLEARCCGETARAVSPLKPAEANDLLNRLIELYEKDLDQVPEGKTFPQLYDVKAVKPLPEYLAVYERAKEKLARLGVNYN